MGNSANSGSINNTNDDHQFDGVETLGYRVLGVQPNSPASTAGLVSFFDFLVGVNGHLIFGVESDESGEFYEDVDFPAFLKQSIGNEVELLVWNIKSKTQRFVNLTPSTDWGGTGLLGVTIRIDNYASAEENLLRILSVEKHSPASIAGLTPNTDYLLGTTTESFENEQILADVLDDCRDQVVEVYVYNTESDVVRVVTLMPTLSWGGRGLLGAEVGRGYLHRLPKSCRDTLGISFERKVRKGARPGSNVNLQKLAITTESSSISKRDEEVKSNEKLNGKRVALESDINDDHDENDMVCAETGSAVHMAPEMEMEVDPTSLSPHGRSAALIQSKMEQIRKKKQVEEIETSRVTGKITSGDDDDDYLYSSSEEFPAPPLLDSLVLDNDSTAHSDSESIVDLPPPPLADV